MMCAPSSGSRMPSAWWAAVVFLLASMPTVDTLAQGVIVLPRPSREVTVTETAPRWLAIPERGRIRTSPGLRFRPLQNSAVTYETSDDATAGVLVGALRNAGACATSLTIRLQYTDPEWRPLGTPVENQARVTQVDPGGAVPYRFPLRRKEEFAQLPSGYIVEVSENGRPVPPVTSEPELIRDVRTEAIKSCSPPRHAVAATIERSRATSRGYTVSGIVSVRGGGSIHPRAIALTALLLDKDGKVLEVLIGGAADHSTKSVGWIEVGEAVPFSLSTPVPLGSSVHRTEIFAEVKTEM